MTTKGQTHATVINVYSTRWPVSRPAKRVNGTAAAISGQE